MQTLQNDERYEWESQYGLWKIIKYNYATEQWEFKQWVSRGHQPAAQESLTTSHEHNEQQSTWSQENNASFANSVMVTKSQPWASGYANEHYNAATTPSSVQYQHPDLQGFPRGEGRPIEGTYVGGGSLHYEAVDRSFYVRSKDFYFEGRVFAVIMNETAGSTATSYNSSLSAVKYTDNLVHTQTRRFVVVRQRPEYCYACPIFTYSNRGTTKRGVRAGEHAIAYSWGQSPQLLAGETGITKSSIPVVMTAGAPSLNTASRIYYGIHHPVQYNVKAKEIGYVPPDFVSTLIRDWKEEDQKDPQSHEQSLNTFEMSTNPRAYFKKGRVFKAIWPESKNPYSEGSTHSDMFAVVKPNPTFSVCLRISTYSGHATTQHGVNPRDHAAVIPVGSVFTPHYLEEALGGEPVEVKVENPEITIDPLSRINLAAPCSINHTVKICNVGRVVGPSVALLGTYLAERLGF